MNISRREFMHMLATAYAAGFWGTASAAKLTTPTNEAKHLYDLPAFGNVSLMHFTDSHAQLLPIYYREPDTHIGTGAMTGEIPHLVGSYFLEKFNIPRNSPEAYALAYMDFSELAQKYGAMGGYANMTTLVKQLRASRPGALLLDGGDSWQGSATALWTNAQDMIDASLLMGVDVMTAHWEFTYGMDRVKEVIENDFAGKLDFVAQNVVDYEFEDPIFEPYVIKEVNGTRVAIIGQAFPYTPIANPRHMVADWQFGINEERAQKMVDRARDEGAQVVVMLSHNGMDIDLKMASRITGVDAILGGHTHDAIPVAKPVKNRNGQTLVINSGSNGKFLSLLELEVRNGKVRDYHYRLVPIFSNLIEPDRAMAEHVKNVRAPFLQKLNQKLAVSDDLLYRRGTFNGTFDQLIVDSLLREKGTEIAFSPGFRWGTNILPGQDITMEDVMSQTAITYPATVVNEMTGASLKEILEDIADNRFNTDPYYQQGGDMVRVGGLDYSIDPIADKGKRINDMEVKGVKIEAGKKYKVASWASVGKDVQGKPMWDVVAEYLQDMKTVKVDHLNMPKIKNMKGNPGIADELS
ncbi:MAG: thiosulfohydrolase SoxB [Gammaproteobacteria bacterium]|nr:thiosulfohydrolase SoxB [Gammaproteobacteria bacterium]